MDHSLEYDADGLDSFIEHTMSDEGDMSRSSNGSEGRERDQRHDEGNAIRQTLDEMGYYQEFSLGSEQLVRRLLDDLKALTARVGRPGVNLDEEVRAEVARLTVENNQLHADLLKEMEDHDRESGRQRSRLRELEEELENLRALGDDARQDAQRRAETAEERAKELAARLDRALRSAEAALEGEDDKEPSLRRRSILSEYSDSAQMLDERIQLLETEINDLDAEAERLRGENERLTDEVSRLRSELDHSNAERRLALQELETRKEATSPGNTQANRRIASLESQLELLRDHVEDLEKDLTAAQTAKKALQARHEEQIRKLTDQLKEEKSTVADLKKDLEARQQESARRALAPKPAPQTSLPKVKAQTATALKRTIVPANRVSASNEEAISAELASTKERLVSAQKELEEQNTEIKTLRRTVEGLRDENESLRTRTPAVKTPIVDTNAQANDESIRFLRDENRRLQSDMADMERSLSQIEAKAQASVALAETKSAEIGQLQEELAETRSMIEDLNEKVANLEQERDGVSTELATSKQSLEQLKLEREALERSLAESRQTAYDLEARIAGIVAERDNILKLYEQLAQEIENEDAKRMAAGNTDNADPVASMQAPAQSSDVCHDPAAQVKIDELSQIIADLQTRLEMQNEAILRLTSSVSPQVNKPTVIDHTHMVNNNAELQERFDDLVKEFNSLGVSHDQQREILEKQRSLLLDLDRDRQRLQTTLEERTLELERLQTINNGLTLQISTLRQQMDSAQNNANAALAQLNRRRDDVIDTQGQLAQLMAEKEALATQLKKVTKDATDASGSVNALVSENQVLTKQMAGLLRDRELMRMDIDAAEAQINQLKEAISMKEDSRNKVLTSYNQLAANNDKLQAELNELSSRNGKLHQDVVNYQKALTEAESALSAKDQQLRTQAAEADTLRRDRVEQLAYLENCKSQLQQTRLELANAVSERNQAVEQLAGKIKDLEVDKLAFENQVAAESARADRFESLATLERTRKENAERTVKDLDLSVSNLTRKMQTLTTQHNEVLASLDKEILALRSERNAVSAKNETLQSQLASLQINLADYEDQVKHKDRIIDELLMNPGDKQRSEVDRKILAELVSTKDQLRSYQSKISQISASSTPAGAQRDLGRSDPFLGPTKTPLQNMRSTNLATPMPRPAKESIASTITDSAERRHILEQEQIRLQSDLRGL